METRHIFSKKERKSSSKHETEWDHQLPNRFLCRTSYEVSVKSSVVQREIKVIRNHRSPFMSANRVNNRQRHGVDSGQTGNDRTTNMQRDIPNSKNPSLLSLPNETTVTENNNNTSSPTVNFSQPERNADKETLSKSSVDKQNPEYSKTHAKTNMRGDHQDSNNSSPLNVPNERVTENNKISSANGSLRNAEKEKVSRSSVDKQNPEYSKTYAKTNMQGYHKDSFNNSSPLNVPNEIVTEKNKISLDNGNFSQPESIAVKEKLLNKTDDNQSPEHSQNSSNFSYLTGKPTGEESGLFCRKFTDPKSNFKNHKKHSNLHSSKNHSRNTYDFSPLTIHSQIPTTSAKKDLAGGDNSETEVKKQATINPESSQFKNSENCLISDVGINGLKTMLPAEESVFSGVNSLNDKFTSNKAFKDYSSISHLGLHRQMLVDEESNSTSSKTFICQETNAKQAWMSNFLGDTHDDFEHFSGLDLKLHNYKNADQIPKKDFLFEKTSFRNCRTSNKKTHGGNESRNEINFDKDFISENNRFLKTHNDLQLSENSNLPSGLNQDLINKLKELPGDPSYGHKASSSNDVSDLFEESKRFSYEDYSNNISSISSMSSRVGESYEKFMNYFDSPTNNEAYTATSNKNIPFGCSTNDYRQALKNVFHPNDPTLVKLGTKSDSSDRNGSFGFELSQIRDSMVKFDDEPSALTQDLRIAKMNSNESSSIVTDSEHQSTTASNTYHSDINSDRWKTSVSELVKYFENLSSETEIREKKLRSDPLVQINSAYDSSEDKNENLLNCDINKVGSMHEKNNMKNECLSKKKYDYKNTFDEEHRRFDNDFQTKLSDLLYHKKSRKDEKYHVDEKDTHKHNIRNVKENGVQRVDKLQETTPSPDASQVDLMHFTTSKCDIHKSQNQLSSLEADYPKESDELNPTDNSPEIGNEILGSDFLQMKGLCSEGYGNLSADDHHKEHNTFSNTRFRATEIARDRSNGVTKEASDYKFCSLEMNLQSSEGNLVERKDHRFECMPKTTKVISIENRNHLESKTAKSSEERDEDQSLSDLQKPNFCDSDTISKSLQGTKLSGRITSSSTEKEESFPDSTSKGVKIVGNPSKRVTFQNEIKLINYWKPPDISNDPSEKSHSWNSKIIKKSTENQISEVNQWSFFSRRRSMALFSMVFFLVFAVPDWYDLLKYFERFSKNQ